MKKQTVTTKNDGDGFKDIFFNGIRIATVNLEHGYIGINSELMITQNSQNSIMYHWYELKEQKK